MLSRSIFCFLLLASSCFAQESNTEPVETPPKAEELREELKAFGPFIGTWVFDDKFKNGMPLWAKNEYTVGMNGNFVTGTTYAKDGDGKEYRRYLTIWRWDEEKKKVVAHGFTSDGSYDETMMEIDMSEEDKPAISSITASKGSPVSMKHTMKIIDDSSFSWKVWSSAAKDALLLDGVWNRQK